MNDQRIIRKASICELQSIELPIDEEKVELSKKRVKNFQIHREKEIKSEDEEL